MSDSNALIDFWLDVQRELEEEHNMPAAEAREALDAYRRRMRDLGAGDALYHWEPRDIAHAIHGKRFAEEHPGSNLVPSRTHRE